MPVSRVNFAVEKAIRIYKENSLDDFVDILFDSGAPLGTSGETAEASIGSLYMDSTNGALYQKVADTDSAGDWQLNGATGATIGTWRPEMVVAVTGEAQGAGTRDMVVNPFSDDDGTPLPVSAFVVGKYVITGSLTSPVLLEITAVSGDDVTFAAAATPLAEDDTFVVRHYLPDADGFENTAIVNYNGSIIIKIADVDWNFADGIQLAAGYAAQNGSITNADSVNSAIEKLDGNQQDIQSTLGVAQGSEDFGTFTGATFADDQTGKQLFQKIEELFEQIRGVRVEGVTTLESIDEVADANAVKWLVEGTLDADVARKQAFEIYALTNGTDTDSTVYAKLKLGANFNFSISVDYSGGVMRLRAASTTGGVTVTARRIEVIKNYDL
jgi:hypothetical protein